MNNLAIRRVLLQEMRKSFLDVIERVDQNVADWFPEGEEDPFQMTNLHIL